MGKSNGVAVAHGIMWSQGLWRPSIPIKLSGTIFAWNTELAELEGLDEAGSAVFRNPGFQTDIF